MSAVEVNRFGNVGVAARKLNGDNARRHCLDPLAVRVAEALKAGGVEVRRDDCQIFDGMASRFAAITDHALPSALYELPHKAPSVYFAPVDVCVAVTTTINAIDNFAAVATRQIDSPLFVVYLLHVR
jgi:uncharacterized lipoprotein YmbA